MKQQEKHSGQFNKIASRLINCRNSKGYWDGHLSSSALGVAVSVIAFHFYDRKFLNDEIRKGISWLVRHVNPDGGFGDSPGSISNVSTSLLCFSAMHLTRNQFSESDRTLSLLCDYLKRSGIDIKSKDISKQILRFYKNDHTFSVPIITTCALCGIPDEEAFDPIPQLPFELALLPMRFYRFLNLQVVSYAIPALVAVGIVIFKHKSSGLLMRTIRKQSIPKVLKLLERIMPSSGGFLEAVPLTAFVVLSLIKSGFSKHEIVDRGILFLRRTQREDGSWPIDVDLSTWVTTLAIKSLGARLYSFLDQKARQSITNHLLSIQNRSIHPFNGSGPGGWGWTHYSGSVPDGDDTPGAILALLHLNPIPEDNVALAVIDGCDWLLKLQNRDGGFPTFSKGWGKLPFDQSCADLTGHNILALASSLEYLGNSLSPVKSSGYKHAIDKAIRYLVRNQHFNGSWNPLWFGNQHHSSQQNPVYGTARVATYLIDSITLHWLHDDIRDTMISCVQKAQGFLIDVQNSDGSWGGDATIRGSIEETALAVSALSNNAKARIQCQNGLNWLEQQNYPYKASPIGLYFASLWYEEKMYPLVMYTEALSRTISR